MNYIFAIDVGGTTVKLGIFNGDGSLLEKWEITTRIDQEGELIIPDIAASVLRKMTERHIDKDQVLGLGVAVPGPVMNNTTALECVNLGWNNKNVSKELGDLLDIQVFLGNDADLAALGEMWQGGGKGFNNIFMVTLGTGVGGGAIVDGKILNGSHGAAGEIGHITVNYDEDILCNCGKTGCLEKYASATGITRLGHELLSKSNQPSKLRDYEELSSKAIFDSAKEGDKLALELLDTFARYLGRGLSHVASLIDPQVFVIGGGVSKAGNIIIDATRPYYKKHVMKSIKATEFKLAKLSNDAGIYGCTKLVLSNLVILKNY